MFDTFQGCPQHPKIQNAPQAFFMFRNPLFLKRKHMSIKCCIQVSMLKSHWPCPAVTLPVADLSSLSDLPKRAVLTPNRWEYLEVIPRNPASAQCWRDQSSTHCHLYLGQTGLNVISYDFLQAKAGSATIYYLIVWYSIFWLMDPTSCG